MPQETQTARFRRMIRDAVFELSECLGDFEQTTNPTFIMPNRIEDVCAALIRAYNEPDASKIRDLSDRIGQFLEGAG